MVILLTISMIGCPLFLYLAACIWFLTYDSLYESVRQWGARRAGLYFGIGVTLGFIMMGILIGGLP